MTAEGPVRVLLCDDSAAARAVMSRMLASDPDIRVVAKASNGGDALAQLAAMPEAERPQVVLLDLEMPHMDGMTALPLLLKAAPRTAVIVASALSQRGAAATMSALRAGAVDYVPKPSAAAGGMNGGQFQAELVAKVKGWARMRRAPGRALQAATHRILSPRVGAQATRPKVIGIGSSTGGPQALAVLVAKLDRPLGVPLVVVQHMPAGFTTLLADHLNRIGTLPCSEAREAEPLVAGRLYLAPGDRHLMVKEAGSGLVVQLGDGPPENFCRPAVDPMLRSLVATCQGRVLAAILTGMGSDGLAGCRAVVGAGGAVLAQDEATSVVWGMPGAVARAGIASAILNVEDIAGRIMAAGADGKRT
ncbi:protein-glutamate methylesterase/protein-glutamine glutaminase [Falsiroseomonas selenitidurans]|uniref:Protein-glutamate methylesterase/protein-glutamine glutaminase n=1 Tax=Falsiroseomonas selenitidurans TaxID=2716335 RepID=A0ABX1E1B2_9PROT|nr:chemotaxis response regulator protein-glutamate methylesterase [Falsiroseomonas selenitidurans]NKC30946.1 chemotaxis response regulator protein-glutamate methylesterase [Falsiroseomonas selenitidurans]